MDLKALKTLQTIVNTGSFNRAAEELNYAQSTVTMQIQRLESDLGCILLERGKHIRLTEAGRLLYEQSLHIVKNIENLQSSLSDLKIGEAGQVRLGVTDPTASYRLPKLLSGFLEQYPKIKVSIEIAGTAALSELLRRGDLDLAIGSAPELGQELYFEPLFMEEFVLLVPENHPLATKESIFPEDLLAHRLLITAANCPYRKKLESLLQDFGGTPTDTMEIGSMTALQYFVASSLGIALVPDIVLNPVPDGMVARKMKGKSIDMSCGIMCRRADYPLKLASSRLYQFLKEELAVQRII